MAILAKKEDGTELRFTVFRPPEKKLISIDFAKQLPSGGVITSIVTTAVTPRANVTEVAALTFTNITFTGTVISGWIEGGTDEEDYEITLTLLDNSGQRHSDDIVIKVRKAGLI